MATVTAEGYQALIGSEIGVSEWILVDQALIDSFADATGDHQFMHVDPAMAAMTPFGGTIAHGFLILSLFPMMRTSSVETMIDGLKMALNYGGNRVRFLTPVRSGSRVRGRFKLLAFEAKGPGRWQETVEFTVEIEGADKPALIAEWLAQIFV